MSSNLLSSDTTCTFIRNCRFYGFTVMYFTLRLLGNYFLEKFLLFICMFICFCICFPFYIYYACFPFYIYSITSNDSWLLTVSFCLWTKLGFIRRTILWKVSFSNVILEIIVNWAKSSDCMLLEDNSLVKSSPNSLLSKFL